MAWTAPYTWTTGHLVTAAELNAQLKNNMRYLKGLDGAATFEDDLTVDNLITSGNVDGVDVSAHATTKAANATLGHVIVETASLIDVDGNGKLTLGSVAGVGGLLADDQHVLDAEVKLIKLDDFATPDDNTDLNASTTEHGLLKKLSNVVTQFMNGQGGWTVPPAGTTYTSGTYTGNGANDRAIAHGLGATPVIIIVVKRGDYGSSGFVCDWKNINVYSDVKVSVSNRDGTNFYVNETTSLFNSAATIYDWVAFA